MLKFQDQFQEHPFSSFSPGKSPSFCNLTMVDQFLNLIVAKVNVTNVITGINFAEDQEVIFCLNVRPHCAYEHECGKNNWYPGVKNTILIFSPSLFQFNVMFVL